jgi:hypothetical protein
MTSAPDTRQPEPRMIDAENAGEVRQVADELRVRPEIVEQAIREVGPNRIAVELWLTAPRP